MIGGFIRIFGEFNEIFNININNNVNVNIEIFNIDIFNIDILYIDSIISFNNNYY